jgi:hypothetical protein
MDVTAGKWGRAACQGQSMIQVVSLRATTESPARRVRRDRLTTRRRRCKGAARDRTTRADADKRLTWVVPTRCSPRLSTGVAAVVRCEGEERREECASKTWNRFERERVSPTPLFLGLAVVQWGSSCCTY